MLTRIGFTAAERTRFNIDGFTTMEILSLQFKGDVKGFKSYVENLNKTFAAASAANLRVYYNPLKLKRIVGVVHYFDQALFSYHQIPDIGLINAALAHQYGGMYDELLGPDEDDPTDSGVELPPLSAKTWTDWDEKFRLKLSQVKSKLLFSIQYVINQTEQDVISPTANRIEVDTATINDSNIFDNSAVHFGTAFKRDNEEVAKIIKVALIDTPSYNVVSKYCDAKNGRKAYLALQASNEGEDFQERTIESAFNILNTTFYRGEMQRFNWEKYVNLHLLAHKLLERAKYANGNGMDEETKIQHLKNNIKADAGLEHSLSTARSNRKNYTTFQDFVNFMTAEVEHKNNRRKQLNVAKGRNVSAVRGGRASGRGGRRAYGRGRVRSDNRNQKKIISAYVDGKTVQGRHYPPQEYAALTTAQKKKVKELRVKRAQAATKSDSTQASVISADIRDAIIAGVKNAAEAPTDTLSVNENKRKSTPSGSVGDFIAKRRAGNKDVDGE